MLDALRATAVVANARAGRPSPDGGRRRQPESVTNCMRSAWVTVLWTTSHTAVKVYYPVGIALGNDGTRLYITGSAGRPGGITTVAYQT